MDACTQDCTGTWGGNTVIDCAGECGGDAVLDCTGECNALALTDECGDCVGGNTGLDACTQDCAGTWGGTLVDDECGICGGDGSTCPPITDYDGNIYATIQIGEQLWMAENLKVTHYNNGDILESGWNGDQWINLNFGGLAVYDDDVSNVEIYGYLYNWHAVDDSRGICPDGWHVPSNTEVKILIDFLGGQSVAGGKMKEAGLEYWNYDNDQTSSEATNESLFSALPGGIRLLEYADMNERAYFWSSSDTDGDSEDAWYYVLYYYGSFVNWYEQSKNFGKSVRCVANQLP